MEVGLKLGFAALPQTYKLLDFLYVIPLSTQVGIYTTALLVWIFFWF